MTTYNATTTNSANANLDTWLPSGGRTVPDIPSYFANNAVFNVKDFGAVGDGSTNDTSAIQNAINAAAVNGGVVLFPAGQTYQAVGLVVRASRSVILVAYGAVLKIKDATAPFCTFYGVQHQVLGGQLTQTTSSDQCQGWVWTNDATTTTTQRCCARDAWAYSVHRAFTVDMLNLSGTGTCYRQMFDRCVAENYTSQGAWTGSYGFKLTGDTVGNAGGNDTRLVSCTAKGYEKNMIIKNSTRTTLVTPSIDGGGIAIEYDAGDGLLIIGGYIEYNTTVFNILNTPHKLVVVGTSFSNYTTFQNGALLNSSPIQGFDTYGDVVGNIPVSGGAIGSGVTRFTGVNEVSFAIGNALDKIIKYLKSGAYFALDLAGIGTTDLDFWFKRTTNGRILFGDPSGNYMGWDVATARALVTSGDIAMSGDETLRIIRHSGTPQGSVTAAPGSLCLNTTGGANTTLYVKESGTGNTGWVAK